MATADDAELVEEFERLFRDYYDDDIKELARGYPNERKSLYLDWSDLYRFDPDLAEDYRSQPEQLQEYAEEALRLYDLPIDVKLGQAHVRIHGLPETTDIRAIRSRHVNTLVSVSGIVRKATDVQPKIQQAAFECQRCGTLTHIPQSGGDFQEPHECQGCERQGPFQINFDQSEFVDAQKLRVQESPEGLRGGETPQALDVHIEDDVTGEVTPGDHVSVTGVLRLEQQGNQQEKSPLFDVYMQGMSVEIDDEQFEDMEITDADKQEIVELSTEPDIHDKMVGSIAPSIYGYDQEKLAMVLQLFSGVTKHLPDESRIRGDLHMLLIGDPGTGKCVSGDTRVALSDGTEHPIRELVESNLDDPNPVDDGVWDHADIELPSLTDDETLEQRTATKVWKREAPSELYRIQTASGTEIEVTPSHPLFVNTGRGPEATPAESLKEGQFVATPNTLPSEGDDALDVAYRLSRSNNAVRFDAPDRWTPELARLVGYVVAEGYVERREDNTGHLFLTNNDREILDDVANTLERYGLNCTERGPHDDKTAREIYCSSSEFVSWLENLEPALLESSAEQRVPEAVMSASTETKTEFLRAYVDAECHVSTTQRELTVASTSEELLRDVQSLLLSLGITSQRFERNNGSYRLRVSGDQFRRYCRKVGFVTERKTKSAAEIDSGETNTNVDVVPGLGDELRRVRERLCLSQHDCGVPRTTYQHYERGDRNPSQESLRKVVATFERRLAELETLRTNIENGDWDAVENARELLGLSQKDLADGIGVSQRSISLYEQGEVAPDGGRVRDAAAVVGDHIDDALHVSDDIAALRSLATNDVSWDRIETIETVKPDDDWVYDLEVEGTHTYVSNGIVSHNSQLLSYVKNIAPRSVYTSGKGSSSAGLTAAAVRDDFGEGQQWTLEAGALVLADQGVAAVDELDKMRCVTGDTLVHLGDGRIDRMREVAAEATDEGTVEPLPNGRTIRDVDLDIWTMTDDGSVVTRPVTAVHEYEAPESLTKVELSSGERLTATDDHPFFVLEDGERVERPAAELCDGDWVYVPRRIPDRATDGGAVATSPDATQPTDDTTAMAAVLGYLAGDGNLYDDREEGVYGIRFTNKEEQLLSHFETACRRAFEGEPTRPPSEQRDDGVETVRLHGREYADAVVEAGMNLETYDGKRLPRAVTTASREAKAAFLRALADSEGSVGSRAVKIHSSSEELLLGAKQLLLEFGVSCQIQHDERTDGRDLYILAITDAGSLRRFERQIGFTLDRKQRALEATCETVDGDRTILDVLPDCGELLEQLRTSLRLHQAECGIGDATYCNFENGDANVSLHRAERILDAFETRRERARSDRDRLRSEENPSWNHLDTLKSRYHVSQSELATGTRYNQQTVSRLWGDDDPLAERVRERLLDVVSEVVETDLTPLRQLVEGDVKWRQVSAVRNGEPSDPTDERTLLRRELADIVGCPRAEAVQRARTLLDRTPHVDDWEALQATMDRYDISHSDLADDIGVHQTTVSRWISGTVETDRFDELRDTTLDRVDTVRKRIRDLLAAVETRSEPAVYDLTVEGTHNFLANGMVVHNSEDRSAMHQALEQQEISISKAGINATLKSRCSLLGAANPKYGRFDQYEPIGEQIDLEPALISRFDLIFTVTDEPDEEEDRNLAEHILTTNYAGELNTQHEQMTSPDVSREEVDDAVEQVDPEIDAELLRKYVAYAKQNCHPRMTDEARAAIREFYVDLRSKGLEEDAPVPVTARQLEALVRLAEASARVRLADTVSEDDAERVIEIVRSCLQDIGVDPETGQFDADVVETGTSKSQRDRIRNLKELIGEIEEEYEEGAPVEVVMDRADEIGMDGSKAEHEIEKLKQKGEVYEPATDHLRTT